MIASPRVSWRSPTGSGFLSRRCIRVLSLAPGSPDLAYVQVDRLLQSARNACRSCSKPAACVIAESLADSLGSTTPSSDSALTWVGNRLAYVAPRKVPYENPR